MSNAVLNINLNNVKDFKDTKKYQNKKLQEVWAECVSKICFLRQLFPKYLETSLQDQLKQDLFGK